MNKSFDSANQKIKKQLGKLRGEMENHELYKQMYQFMLCSPMMQELVMENRKLKSEKIVQNYESDCLK